MTVMSLLLKNKLIFAPMATLSHTGFRFLIQHWGGCDLFFTEMIHAPTFLSNGNFEKFYVDA